MLDLGLGPTVGILPPTEGTQFFRYFTFSNTIELKSNSQTPFYTYTTGNVVTEPRPKLKHIFYQKGYVNHLNIVK